MGWDLLIKLFPLVLSILPFGLIVWLGSELFKQQEAYQQTTQQEISDLNEKELQPLKEKIETLEVIVESCEKQLGGVRNFIENYHKRQEESEEPETSQDPLEIIAEEQRRFARSKSREEPGS